MLLEELCRLSGVTGDEGEVRAFLRDRLKDKVDELYCDRIGNLIAVKYSDHGKDAPCVMLAAHMDEVGLIVTGIRPDGTLRFRPVGEIDPRVLISKRVYIGKDRVPGVIGTMAIHLIADRAEMKKAHPVDKLYIDIGVDSKKAAEKLVEKGDFITFDPRTVYFGDAMFKSKAIDDRLGCAMAVEALEAGPYPVTIAAAFTVMEEIGSRGAGPAAFGMRPDAALVFEGTTCADMAGVPDQLRVTRPGHGPAIGIGDHDALVDKRLRGFLIETAEKSGIAWQNRAGTFGGTDGGEMQRAGGSRPVANLSVPTRYIHSPVCAVNLKDYDAAVRLMKLTLSSMDRFFEGGDR